MISKKNMQLPNDAEQSIFDLGLATGQTCGLRAPTQQDTYTWQVQYTDGTLTNEYDEARPDGREWSAREEKSVQSIILLPVEQATEVHSIPIPEDATPIFFRRRSIAFNPNTGEQQSRPTVHCIGWKRNTEAVYLFVFDSGQTLLTNDLQAV